MSPLLNDVLRFHQPVRAHPASGLPTALETVPQSIDAIAFLPPAIRDRVHWRFALTVLKFVSKSRAGGGAEMARGALISALTADGWLLGSPPSREHHR
jgi:hypothetical protein